MTQTTVLVKKEAKTNPKVGCEPNKRSVDELIKFGVVNLDKPAGPTSHQVSDYVQRIVGIEKAGHSGSLDPRVTGLLPVALDHATRISHVLLKGGKSYVGILHLHNEVKEEQLREAIQKFRGKIMQLPPVKSAVKRELRQRTIYSFEILEIEERDILFSVDCEAGTYIRKLCHDLGQALGVGAHMADLRRVRVSSFTEEDAVTLQDLQDAVVFWKEENNDKFIRHCIKPAERMLEHLAKVWVLDSAVESICHGRDVGIPGVSKLTTFKKGQMIAIMTLKNELVALGNAMMDSAQVMKEERGIAVKTHKVFMAPGVYGNV